MSPAAWELARRWTLPPQRRMPGVRAAPASTPAWAPSPLPALAALVAIGVGLGAWLFGAGGGSGRHWNAGSMPTFHCFKNSFKRRRLSQDFPILAVVVQVAAGFEDNIHQVILLRGSLRNDDVHLLVKHPRNRAASAMLPPFPKAWRISLTVRLRLSTC